MIRTRGSSCLSQDETLTVNDIEDDVEEPAVLGTVVQEQAGVPGQVQSGHDAESGCLDLQDDGRQSCYKDNDQERISVLTTGLECAERIRMRSEE